MGHQGDMIQVLIAGQCFFYVGTGSSSNYERLLLFKYRPFGPDLHKSKMADKKQNGPIVIKVAMPLSKPHEHSFRAAARKKWVTL